MQYLVLAHASSYPQLAENVGNIALLKRLADLNVISQASADEVADAYRTYRIMQHASSLQGTTLARVELENVEVHVNAVTALWAQVFS